MSLRRWLPYGSALIYCLSGWSTLAQSTDRSIIPIPSGWLSALPAGWTQAGAVQLTPFQAEAKTKAGSGIAVGKPGQPATLLSNVKDVRLVLDVMLSPGSDAVLSLGTVGVRLSDSWGKSGVNAATFGSVMSPSTILPDQNACQAPGVWQRLDVLFEAGKPGSAVIDRMTLNGVRLHENLVLPPVTGASAGIVAVQVTNGTVAIRPVGYQLISDRKVARLTTIRYKFYEAKTETTSPEALSNLRFVKEDTLSTLTYEIAQGQPRWHGIVYTGNLVVDKAGEYTVALQNGGYAGLQIDGKEVVPNTYLDLGKMNSAKINLTAGSHPFTLFFGRSWPRPGLGMFISASDTKFQALHTRGSLPEPDPVGIIAVQATAKPALIRSFVQMPTEKRKRTHSLSVGTPSGLHYTVDLNQDALLQVWRGQFANVTEMWYERGEPQLLTPMGVTVPITGQGSLAVLATMQQAWPDSLTEKEVDYTGLKLDAAGYPTTNYKLYGMQVSDALRPDTDQDAGSGKALNRTLTVTGSENGNLYCRLAADSAIEEAGKGVYVVGDHRYFVRIDPKLKPIVRTVAGQQELLLPVSLKNGSATVSYSIIW